MTAERLRVMRRELFELIRDELRNATPDERLHWLVQRLEIYVRRWLEFCSSPTLPFSSLVNSDLHYIVLAAAEKIDDELARDHRKQSRAPAWHSFARCFRSIDDRAAQQIAVNVSQGFEMAKKELLVN